MIRGWVLTQRSFNPRSPGGSDLSLQNLCRLCSLSFNPRSPGGSDHRDQVHLRPYRVSIHAPQEGATPLLLCSRMLFKFQSTLPRRERRQLEAQRFGNAMFQSTLPRRERRTKDIENGTDTPVSIHAPQEGATIREVTKMVELVFQSTLPRRERRGGDYTRLQPVRRFNPRSPGGSDLVTMETTTPTAVSIHAPQEGATLIKWQVVHMAEFQSTLPRRERRKWLTNMAYTPVFQSTLPRRERQPNVAALKIKI